jgi:hypothetical protein
MKGPPRNGSAVARAGNDGADSTRQRQPSNLTADAGLPQFRDRRAFLIWACMIGVVPPERVVERVVAEIEAKQ